MYFRDLSIHASDHAEMPNGRTTNDFNLTVHAVQEIFRTFMPRKYPLDGMAKTNLTLGSSGGALQYEQLIDVNIYYVEDFDFLAYFAASIQQRDEILLSVLERCLLDIGRRHGADPEPMRKAISDTRACGGERRCVMTRLSRLTKSRKLKLNVFRHICHEGERWGIDIIDRKGTLLQSRWTAKRANWRQAGQDYRGSALRGDNFVLLDFLGRQSYKLNVIQLEVKILGALGASHTD